MNRGESGEIVATEVVDLLNVEEDEEPIDLTTSPYSNRCIFNRPNIIQHQPIDLSLDVHPSTSSFQQLVLLIFETNMVIFFTFYQKFS